MKYLREVFIENWGEKNEKENCIGKANKMS